jgi:hypothetical protein
MQDERKFGWKLPIGNGSECESAATRFATGRGNYWKYRFEAPHPSEFAVNKGFNTYAPCGRRRAAEQA